MTGEPGSSRAPRLDRLEPDLDWLFIDVNGNGRRDFDADARPEGEATDALGEPLFAMLDRDGDGQFSARDRLIPLRRSRVHVYRNADRTYRRGVDLTQAPHDSDLHGTGVWGILAGGPTHHRFAGIAPRATILHFHRNRYNLVDAIHFAVAEKAHLVLHEYGAWVHQYGDGSSIVERLVGHSQTLGIPHVLPAGNLASSRRSARFTLAAGETKTLTLFLPRRQIQVLYGSVIWTGSESVQAFVTPRNGREERLPTAALQAQDFDDPSRRVSAEQRTNERGTHKLDWVLWGWQGRLAQLPDRAWTMRLVNPSDQPAEAPLAHRRQQNIVDRWRAFSWRGLLDQNQLCDLAFDRNGRCRSRRLGLRLHRALRSSRRARERSDRRLAQLLWAWTAQRWSSPQRSSRSR